MSFNFWKLLKYFHETGAMAIFIVMALSWLPVYGANSSAGDDSSSEELTVSLITCYPGPEIYELCGHEAIRIRGKGIDRVWNYGLFDFNEPNFVYRFVKGETDYKVAGYPFRYFLPEYIERGSRVVEQDLNFTPEEAEKMLSLLNEASLPENARYRYNYVKDNCATRILIKMDEASQNPIIYPDSVAFGTFRNEMRAYHKGYPWYQFGIDLALGSGLDYRLNSREEMFVPVEMMKKVGGAHFSDGRPLVKATRVLNEGVADATLPPTPWWQTPLFWSWVAALLSLGMVYTDLRRGKLTVPFYVMWFAVTGLAGLLVVFLVFISEHEATSPNALVIWLNPFQLVFAAGILIRKIRPLAIAMAYYDIIAVTVLLVVWPFLRQSANPAFFPLMGATVVLSLAYAIIAHKSSYNNNGAIAAPKSKSKKKQPSKKGKIIVRRRET